MTADHKNETLAECDEIEALLPWYVTGKLDSVQSARVERYIEVHPEIAMHIALAREESEATIASNEAIVTPGRRALDRLRASIAAVPRRTSAGNLLQTSLNTCAEWLGSLAPPQLTFAAAAAAFLVVIQAATIGTLLVERGTETYRTATGTDTRTGNGIDIVVSFSETATISEITALLQKLNAGVVEGPRAGFYRIRVPKAASGDGGREKLLSELRQSRIVTVALPGS